MQLRPYQENLEHAIHNAWASGARNVLAVLPTGAGKTVIFSKILADNAGPACAIAHRQELVGQISLAFAQRGVRHRIIGPKNVVKYVVQLHMEVIGRSYYDPGARVGVAGVDTLVRRGTELATWCSSVTLTAQDEAHHILQANKWGTAVDMFPNALLLGVTATPTRADGRGLGRHADGVMDVMVSGPEMRDLIDDGFITDYRIIWPGNSIDLADVPLSKATGDYNKDKLRKAVRRSRIVGDVVAEYLKHAGGKLGITFATDVETATEIAAEYNAKGVPAEVISHKTENSVRAAILRRFKAREVLQLVNVDLFGEGFDLPAVEVVSFARPTQSYSLYCQQFGRALRLMVPPDADLSTRAARLEAIARSVKPKAIIIDHVGNVEQHRLPDARREWTLDRRERGARSVPTDAVPIRVCAECTSVFERTHARCPFCGWHPVPSSRSKPELVDGDLLELDAETLERMRGEVEGVDVDKEEYRAQLLATGLPDMYVRSNIKAHVNRQGMQTALRGVIAWWAGYQRAKGRPDSESYRRFYHRFGIDVLSAQKLPRAEARTLAERVSVYLGRLGQ